MGERSVAVAYCLWFFLGLFGIHRFYLDRNVSGIIYLFTLGIFGIGWIVDLFLIPGMVEHYNIHHGHHHHHHESSHTVVYQAVPAPAPYGYQVPYGQPPPVGAAVYQAPPPQPVYV
eukprot:Mycagemm_TRINITY_DN10152_c0_g1::TRINITY_DN10152_c0_g1_i1::g.5256::m.5256 type:complete len:116 gc:universal TRINITY_DN10152_c0_g1_i1:40-387(+)